MLGNLPCAIPMLSDRVSMPVVNMPSDYLALCSNAPQSIQSAPSSQLSAPSQSTAIAPVFQKIVDYLDGRDWTRDNAIKQGIADLKERNEPIEVIQGYLQYLEVSGHLETRNAGRNGLEAKKI